MFASLCLQFSIFKLVYFSLFLSEFDFIHPQSPQEVLSLQPLWCGHRWQAECKMLRATRASKTCLSIDRCAPPDICNALSFSAPQVTQPWTNLQLKPQTSHSASTRLHLATIHCKTKRFTDQKLSSPIFARRSFVPHQWHLHLSPLNDV